MGKLSKYCFLLFLFTISLDCQNLDDNFDFYKSTSDLWEKLKDWQNQDYREQRIGEIDFDKIFSQYYYEVYQTSPDTFYLIAKLPLYLNIITTELSFQFTKNFLNIERFDYVPNITYRDSMIIFDDSVKVKIIGGEKFSESVISILKNRFPLYRTLGLPQEFRPEYTRTDAKVKLFFHARDIDSLIYKSRSQWLRTMNQLSKNKMVYAGPTSVIVSNDLLKINFYVLITTQQASGHHFFLIEEVLRKVDNDFSIESLIVDFYPYVRVDNLLSLYGVDSSRVNRKSFLIKINRR